MDLLTLNAVLRFCDISSRNCILRQTCGDIAKKKIHPQPVTGVCVRACVCVYVRACVYMRACTCVRMCVCVCMCVCVRVRACVTQTVQSKVKQLDSCSTGVTKNNSSLATQ